MNKTYTINGMTCEHCVHAITEEVSGIDGVKNVQVSLASGSMDVSSDAEIDFAKIADAVDEAGDYTVSKATSLDTAGHPGGECGCGGHHAEGESCGCGAHEGHQHSADAAEKHAHHGEGEACGCGGQHAEGESCGCGAHEGHQHSADAAEKHAHHGEGESCGCGHHHEAGAQEHSHVMGADATAEPAESTGLIGKLLHH